MKKIIPFLITTVFFGATVFWLYALKTGIAAHYEMTYHTFNMKVPLITRYFLASLDYAVLMVVVVAVISYMPVILFKGKAQYWSVVLSFLLAISFVGVLYLPAFYSGPVV